MTAGQLKRYLENINDDDVVYVVDNKTMYEATIVPNSLNLHDRVVFVRDMKMRVAV